MQLAMLKSLFECVDELAAKEFTQHFLGKEVVVAGTNPTGAIKRETAGRHDAMHMRVSGELLAPCMQDAEEAHLCAEVSGIARGRNEKPESTLLPKLRQCRTQWSDRYSNKSERVVHLEHQENCAGNGQSGEEQTHYHGKVGGGI